MARYETEGSSALAPSDPYNDMGRAEIRPDLRVIEGGRRSEASNDLAQSEQTAAATPLSVIDGGMARANTAERNQPYTPPFTGAGRSEGKKDQGKGKGFLKRKGPLMAIMSILVGGGGLIAGSQVMMPFASANRIMQEFNSMKTVMSTRSDRLLRYQMDTERYRSPTKTTIFGNEKFKIAPGSHQAKKLKAEGIDVMEVDVDGKKVRLLVYDDGSGVKQPILTNTDINPSRVDPDALNRSLQGAAQDIEFNSKAISIDAAFEIGGFKNGYLTSSKTWKGNIAGWFDSLVLKVFDRLGISRNRFNKWKTASDIEAGNAAFKEAAQNKRLVDDDGTSGSKVDEEEVKNDDGTSSKHDVPQDLETEGEVNGNKVSVDPSDSVTGKKSLTEVHAALESKVVKSAQAAGNLLCAAFAAVGAVHAIVAAQQAAEILNLVSGYLEAVQKVQAGAGDGSPVAHYTNALTEKGSNGKSAMASQGMGALFGSGGISTSNSSVQATNSESLLPKLKLLGAEIQYSADAFKNCAYVKAGAAAVGLVVDIIGAFTFGIASLFKGVVKSIGMGVIMGTLLPLLTSAIIKPAAEMMMKNYITDFVGEDLGNAIMSGANKYLGGNHQGGGGSPGDKATVLAFRRETERILAEEAEYDRQNRSPFDVSSPNTFLGSLLYTVIPVASSSTSLTSLVSSVGSVVGSSLGALLPSASAVAETQLVTTQGDCPLLESVNIMGDAYCNPYYTSDMTTIDYDPGENYTAVLEQHLMENAYPSSTPLQDEPSYCAVAWDGNTPIAWSYHKATNFKYGSDAPTNIDDPEGCVLDVALDESDNPIININSALGRYITFCGQRSSPWGLADGNIASQVVALNIDTGVGELDGALNGIVGAIPFIGDGMDLIQSASELDNIPWVGGSACVASSENGEWEENRLYQRYVEDQRWLESSGMIEESAVLAVLNDYYEANPLDNSYEGIIARFSGMTKEQVIATLELVEQANFLAQYDPSGLQPALTPAKPEKKLSFTNSAPALIAPENTIAIAPQFVLYTDTRNRSFAA